MTVPRTPSVTRNSPMPINPAVTGPASSTKPPLRPGDSCSKARAPKCRSSAVAVARHRGAAGEPITPSRAARTRETRHEERGSEHTAEVNRLYFGWPTRVAWGCVMAVVVGVAVGMPLLLLLDEASTPTWAGAVLAVPVAGAALRGLRVGFRFDTQGVFVRNPWRTYRLKWSEVEAITDAQPGALRGALCPALRVVGWRRRLPLCSLACWSRRGEARLARLFRLWATLLPVPVRPEVAQVADHL